MSSTLAPDSWLPFISKIILQADEIPLISAPAISKDKLQESLHSILQTKELKLDFQEFQWKEGTDLLSGIGKNPKAINITLAPLDGVITLVLSEEDLLRLLGLTLNLEKSFAPSEIMDAYLDFFAAKVMQSLETHGALQGLSARLLKEKNLPSELSLVLNCSLHTEKGDISAKLFLSNTFRKSWQRHVSAGMQKPSNIPPHIPINLSLGVGKINLTLKEWKSVSSGDFIVIDPLGYDPKTKNGNVFLSYKSSVLFHGGLNANKIKISDSIPHTAEAASMTKEPKKDNEPHEGDSSFFLGEDEEFFLEDEELAKVLKEELANPEKSPEASKSEPAPKTEKAAPPKKAIGAHDIPLSIKVEIGSLTLTAKELLQLQPGNELSLGKNIDNSVNLLVGGKCIARGELVKMGDILGVRILSL